MLSATYGAMPHGYGGGPDFGQHGGGGSRFANSGAFVSQPGRFDGYGLQAGPALQGYQDQPPMHAAVEQGWSPDPMWHQFDAGPPPMMREVTFRPEPAFSSYTYDYVISETYLVNSPPNSLSPPVEPRYGDDFPSGSLPPDKPSGTSSRNANGVFDQIDRQVTTYNVFNHNQLPGFPSFDQIGSVIPTAADLLGFRSSPTEGSVVSPIVSRETNAVATLAAAARDLAFQEFSPKLFQAIGTNSYEGTTLGALGTATTPSDVLDGFIPPSDPSVADDVVHSTDAVAREREAVDAVLRDLHDVDRLLPATASTDANLTIDSPTEMTADDIRVNDVDGGMVLLQSTGDVNESGFDLTPVYADRVERFDVPAGMETSVGFYQAVDVAADEASVTDTASPTDLKIELNREIKSDDNLPLKREESSNHKATALVGATILTGAMVWMNRGGIESTQVEPIAQKRRVSCG